MYLIVIFLNEYVKRLLMKHGSCIVKKKQQKSDTFHAGVKSCERRGGVYPVHLRLFDFVVEDRYVSISEYFSKKLIANKFNFHYEGYIIRYADTQCNIDNLQMGEVLLEDLENVGCVGFKYVYIIIPHSNVREYVIF